LGPWPGNWCTDTIYELDWVLSIQKFGPVSDETVPYVTTTEVWTANMFQIEEEWTKKGKEWTKSVTKKDKLTRTIKEEINAARTTYEAEREAIINSSDSDGDEGSNDSSEDSD